MIDCTSVNSTAMMLAHVALDRRVGGGRFAFTGDRISILGTAEVIEEKTGRTSSRHSSGSEADWRAAMGAAKKDTANSFNSVVLAYQLYMLNGQTALTGLQNERHIDVKLESFA